MMPVLTADDSWLGTAASGPSGSPFKLRAVVSIGDLLWAPRLATASTYLIERRLARTAANPDDQIDSVPAETTGEAIFEIRRRCALTWEELADLFGVSRRSVHHWASGKAMTAEHDQRVRRTLAVVRQLDQGEGKRTRDFLLAPSSNGDLPFDLIKSGDAVGAMAFRGIAKPRVRLPPNHKIRLARQPPRPADLVDALTDRPDTATTARVARTFRAP